MKKIDVFDKINTKINFLFILKEDIVISKDKNKTRVLVCRCDCGSIITKNIHSVINGITKSCGCYHDSLFLKRAKTHGMSKSLEFKTWCCLIQRCRNKNRNTYKYYGGRGIKVCDRWLGRENGFANFLSDIGKRPTPQHSIDRIDVNGNYEPKNCRWDTRKEQRMNTRQIVLVTYNGETKCVQEWSNIYGIPRNTIKYRLKQNYPLIDVFKKK